MTKNNLSVWIGYMRLVVYSLTGCLLCSTAVAKYCVKLPTCEELGYIYSADKYPNNRSIKCPFDTKKILLLDYCQAYGLTSCDSTSGECDECIVEKADGTKSNSGYWRYTRCNAGYSYKSGECPPTEVDTSKYPFTQGELNEEIGEVECMQSGQNTYCGYKSCNEGWNLNSGNCIVNDCGSSYPYTSCDTNGTCTECQSGTNTKYSAPTCNLGWYASGSSCVENDCSAYPETSNSITGCSSSSSCLSGTKTTYKCDTCYTGYEVLNGACNKTCTYTATNLPTNCATATGSCQLGSASGTTTYYATTCSTCNNGYEVSSGSCVAAACTGFNSASSTIANCSTTSSCQKGATKVYKCDTCTTDYEPDENGGCKLSCALSLTTLPTGCSTVTDSCVKNGTTYYSDICLTCISGYEFDGNGKCKVKSYAIGDIYEYNGTPIGVVFYDDENITKIVALTDITKDGTSRSEKMSWANSSSYDWNTGATQTSVESTALKDTNGKYNTQKILAYIKANRRTAEAATATSLYAPSVCRTGSICAKGNWYLPAAGELWTLYSNKATLNSKFTSNSGTAFLTLSYWSSTEYDSGNAWTIFFNSGSRYLTNKGSTYYVRPVLEISKESENTEGSEPETGADSEGETTCSLTATSLPSNCTQATDSCSKNGTTYYSTSCTTCNDGWTASSGSCVVNSCSGYGSSSYGCSNYTTCKSGNTTKYKCSKCESCYSLSNNQCYDQNTCSAAAYHGERTSSPYTDDECLNLYSNGATATTCQKCGITYYACYCSVCNPFMD